MRSIVIACRLATYIRFLKILLLTALALQVVPGALLYAEEGVSVPNPGTDLWREVRKRNAAEQSIQAPGINLWNEVQQRNAAAIPAGNTQASGVESGELINSYGDQWRRFRMEILMPYGGYTLAGMALFVALFYFIRGRVPIHAGASDKVLFRYTVYERMIHWFIASIFLFQAITGLILLFGRDFLIPLVGKDIFALLASASKEGHNLFGPIFFVALTLVFFKFLRRNIYQKGDLTWLLKGGGVVGKKHVPSNFFNMGEKSMFWLLVFVGGTLMVSGFILIFPTFGQGRGIMALTHAAHGITAVAMTAVVIGHIYIGTIGMEAALEGMKTGYCDLNWAREHHDWWAQRCEEEGRVLSRDQLHSVVAGTNPPEPMVSDTTEETAK